MTTTASCVSRILQSLSSVSTSRWRSTTNTPLQLAETAAAASTAAWDERPGHTPSLVAADFGRSSPATGVSASLVARQLGGTTRTAVDTSRWTEETRRLRRRRSTAAVRCARSLRRPAQWREDERRHPGIQFPAGNH